MDILNRHSIYALQACGGLCFFRFSLKRENIYIYTYIYIYVVKWENKKTDKPDKTGSRQTSKRSSSQ